MCLIENDIKPIGDIFYKVFLEKEGKLYWCTRDATGKYLNPETERDEIPDGRLTSTEIGFHCWDKEEDAQTYAKLLSILLPGLLKNYSLVVKRVRVSYLIKSGTCPCGAINQDEKDRWEILTIVGYGNQVRKQVFTFKYIEGIL